MIAKQETTGAPGRAPDRPWPPSSTAWPKRSAGHAIYLRLPEDARLWLRGDEFVIADRPALEAALDAS